MATYRTIPAPKIIAMGDTVGFYSAKFRGAKIRQLYEGVEELTGIVVGVKPHKTKAKQVFTIRVAGREDFKVYGRELYYKLFHHSSKTI